MQCLLSLSNITLFIAEHGWVCTTDRGLPDGQLGGWRAEADDAVSSVWLLAGVPALRAEDVLVLPRGERECITEHGPLSRPGA
jgi:hypothetical protein